MSLTLNIGRSYSDYNKVDKDFSLIKSESAVIKEQSSIINPVFIVNAFSNMASTNYLKCPDLGRNYYINNIEMLPGGRAALSCHVDVLASFASGIRSCQAIIDKQQNMTNASKFIDDGSYVMECRDKIESYNFSAGFTSSAHILITAGG